MPHSAAEACRHRARHRGGGARNDGAGMSRRHTPLAADIKAIHVAEDATPAAPGELPLLLTIIETARATGMGLTHTRKLISSGVLPSARLSPRIIRVPRDALL